MSFVIQTHQFRTAHLQKKQSLDQLSFDSLLSLKCLSTNAKQDHQIYIINDMIQTSDKFDHSHLGAKRKIYIVVIKKFQELVSLTALSLKYKDFLDIIKFTFCQEETSFTIWIQIIYNNVKDLSINQRFQEQVRQENSFNIKFFSALEQTMIQSSQYHFNLNIFLILLLKTITRPSNGTQLTQDQPFGDGISLDHKLYQCSSDLNSNRTIPQSFPNRNSQSNQYIIQTSRETDKSYFQNVNQILKKQDLMGLKTLWDNSLKNKLENIGKNWNIYKDSLHSQISLFTRLNMYKKFRLNNALNYNKPEWHTQANFYEQIYPKMSHFVDFFSKKLRIQSIENYFKVKPSQKPKQEKNIINDSILESDQDGKQIQEGIVQKHLQRLRLQLQIEENPADKIFYQILREERTMSDKIYNVLVNESIELSAFASYCQNFHKHSSHWSNLFTTFYHSLNKTKSINNSFFSNIQHQRLVQNQCLGCSKFFILDQNIYDEHVNRSPIKVFSSIRKLKQIEANLKDEICGMLNSGGGIILFNCRQRYRGIYPQGNSMTQKDKEQFEQRIYSYSSQFYPKLQIKDHIHITFVPIVSLEESQPGEPNQKKKYTGQEGMLKENYCYNNRNYCKGLFVARIKVMPADPSLVYFWFVRPSNQGEIRSFCQIKNSDGTCSKLTVRKIVKLIKQKMNQFYIKQSLPNLDKHLLLHPTGYIQHECPEPDVGITMAEISKIQNFQKSPQVNSLEDQFNYLTLLVAGRQFHQKIKQNFRKNRLNFQIRVPFEEDKFTTALHTAALYHNNKFQQILRFVNNNPSFIFYGRQVLVINVTSFLKLEKRNQCNTLSQKQFDKIANLFFKRFSNQTLKAFRFKTTNPKSKYEYEYYLLTQTKISNLYLYYLINQQLQKSVFKNPYLLDKLSKDEREQRMVILFERKGKNQLISNYVDKRNQSFIVDMLQFSYPLQDSTNLEDYGDADLFDPTSRGSWEDAIKQESTILGLKDQKKQQSIELQEEYFYENWQQVLKVYDYSIDAKNKSQKIQDL